VTERRIIARSGGKIQAFEAPEQFPDFLVRFA
jgi:hypothetical protein